MKVVAAIVARTHSPASPADLMPQRCLARVKGKTVLEWVLERLKDSNILNGVVMAVGNDREDRVILDLADRFGINSYSGYPEAVLSRLLMVARAENADHVVRINGNFPLVDVSSLDDLVEGHISNQADFSLNSHYHGLVYGLGVEVFSRQALERFSNEQISPLQKSIGSLYLMQNPSDYRIYRLPSQRTAPHLRVSVDFESDLQVISEILSHVPEPDNDRIIDFLQSRPDLASSREMMAPSEVSLEKVLLFPDKITALRKNNHVTFDTSYPISVELTLTNRCNHHCIWCSDGDLRQRLGGEMDESTLFPLFEELKRGGTRGIVIEGGGEPTLHCQFIPIVHKIKDLGLAMGLITNGYSLPYLDHVENFEWIRISLDASSRNQYQELKGVDGFDQVINNLMALASSRRQSTLGVGYVLTNRNDDLFKLEQLVLFLRKIGANYIQFRPVVDHPELFSEADLSFLKKYETEYFSVNTAALNENRDWGNAGLGCLAHSLSTVITADGGIYLCGRLNRFDTWEPIGNLHDMTFDKIWTGEKRRSQVRIVSRGSFCRTHCPQCRMSKYNKLLSDIERVKTRNFI